jgi:hypothetical protein
MKKWDTLTDKQKAKTDPERFPRKKLEKERKKVSKEKQEKRGKLFY